MIFTDDNLKRCQKDTPENRTYLEFDKWKALLARLEAAERCINPANCYAVDYEAWCKACRVK